MTNENEAKSTRILLGLVLVLTATIALFWSHNRLIDQDEAFVLQTDSVASVSRLIEVQRHFPISLDPLFYHLLGHASTRLFGSTAFAIRLPSILGYLLMQCCLFAVAKRIAGARAGVLAACIPVITVTTLFFAQHARPYGVLLGLGSLLLLAYQHSTRDPRRTGWLIALALSLALALNTHYFAILLLLPLYAAESVRITQRRRIDWPVVFAIGVGSAGALLTLPFQKGVGEFRKHYYNAGKISFHYVITRRYSTLTLNYTGHTILTYTIMAVLILVTTAFVAGVLLRIRSKGPVVPIAEKVFLAVLSTLPLFGFLLALFVTHSIEIRYVLPAILGIAVFLAIAVAPALHNVHRFHAITGMLLGILLCIGIVQIAEARTQKRETLASLAIPETPGGNSLIYMQNMRYFDELAPHIPDPELRKRVALVYSVPLEIELAHQDTGALTSEHMRHFTGYTITSYEDLRRQPGAHLMILYQQKDCSWDWLSCQLAHDHATITPLGSALKGDLVSVTFPQ